MLDEVLCEVNGKLDGKIVIDATNPLKWTQERGLERLIPQEITAGRVMAQQLPTDRVVKAFTTVHAPKLESEAHRQGELLAIAMAGDERAAKETVTQLVEDAGYFAVDIGSLDESAPLDPSGVL